ncbi:MAG TPA: APC family permease [Jatrophihabitans sp.]|jgi:APA family basic amino acid/polyamine antiporter|uniref:APC family permease n=1 Tax=Jatrophihabitans sp. TaxID=1932789 RepID=UPI002E072F84|nr:APC family permease [Jatrophihabitans sp.]
MTRTLQRRLGVGDAVTVGLGSMLGAGVFAAFGPAARAAGAGLLIGLALAAVVAYCNATSSARLAALYPESGGTYVYGRRRLGPFWGHLAGWSFVVGKTASCAAMALTFASYAAPSHLRLVGALAVAALTALTLRGVQKSALATRVIVGVVLVVLLLVVVACLAGGTATTAHLELTGAGLHGVLQAAGLLFFAFAGYARIATLGEEVRDPARTIPRAITVALAIVVVVYALVAVAALAAAGPAVLAHSAAPLRTAVELGDLHRLGPVVRIGGAVAALGSLLALLLGVSRTTLAMARDRHLPGVLAFVHPRHAVPQHAELAVGAVVVVLVLTADLRSAIGFSSFGVLAYYAVANASALTLRADEHRPPRWLPVLGVIGCVVLAASLPAVSVVTGAGVLLLGGLAYLVTRRHGGASTPA